MTPKELAAAIRRGHTMIDERRIPWYGHYNDRPCGCALGAAMAGSGYEVPNSNFVYNTRSIADALGIAFDLASEVSGKHFQKMPRLAIADWLDTLEPETKQDDAVAYAAFKATLFSPVPVGGLDSLDAKVNKETL